MQNAPKGEPLNVPGLGNLSNQIITAFLAFGEVWVLSAFVDQQMNKEKADRVEDLLTKWYTY